MESMSMDRSNNASEKEETSPTVLNQNCVKLEDKSSENQVSAADDTTTPSVVPTPFSKAISSPCDNDNSKDTPAIEADVSKYHPSKTVEDQDADSKIKFDDEETNCQPLPFTDEMTSTTSLPVPNPYNLSIHPSRKLSFEDDQCLGLMSSPNQRSSNDYEDERKGNSSTSNTFPNLTFQESQDIGSPPPIGAAGSFPSSGFEDMSFFPSFQNQYHVDDSYSSNLLGCAFFPSPNDNGPLSSNINIAPSHHFLVNIHDIRAQYGGPTLNGNNNAFPPLMKSLHSSNNHNSKQKEDDEEGGGNQRTRSMGKTLDSLDKISTSTTRNNRPKLLRQMNRNLPLRKRARKRHISLDHGQEVMTTPVSTARSSHRMVSRSISVEKKKGGGSTSIQHISRNRSRRQSTKSFPRTSTTSAARFNNVPPTLSLGNGKVRVIQHFTPKRNTVPILSADTTITIPNTLIVGCKCSKSKCLKLYCDCFQAGQVCADRCGCKGCLNTVEESGKGGRRTKAVQSILDRRPDAFDVRVKKTGQGCSCKKNKCLKKYCDCFSIGIKCDKDKCRCTDCENYPMDDDIRDDQSSVTVTDEKDHIDYGEDDTDMCDIQTPFYQEEEDHDDFIIATSSNNLLDDKTPLFQDDITAV